MNLGKRTSKTPAYSKKSAVKKNKPNPLQGKGTPPKRSYSTMNKSIAESLVNVSPEKRAMMSKKIGNVIKQSISQTKGRYHGVRGN